MTDELLEVVPWSWHVRLREWLAYRWAKLRGRPYVYFTVNRMPRNEHGTTDAGDRLQVVETGEVMRVLSVDEKHNLIRVYRGDQESS